MLCAAGAINAIARAVVERVMSAGLLAPHQHERVNDALGGFAARFSWVLRKAMSKPALCATSGASPTNAMNSSATAGRVACQLRTQPTGHAPRARRLA